MKYSLCLFGGRFSVRQHPKMGHVRGVKYVNVDIEILSFGCPV